MKEILNNIKFLLQIDKNNEYLDSFVFDCANILNKSFTNYTYSHINYCDDQLLLNNKYNINIPIGSIEFVEKYLKLNDIEVPKPLNIPIVFRNSEFCQRNIKILEYSELISNFDKYKNYFVKSNEKYKHFNITKTKYIQYDNIQNINNNTNLFISSDIEQISSIKSEYRCFVLMDRIVSINNYVGFPLGLTDEIIKSKLYPIIEVMKNLYKLRSYTIDFAILEDNSFELIELHHGYSCGNYGFNNDKYLSFLINGITQLIK